ncbi:MAG: hypothetical protein WC314_09155 [Vulcanimicrobiota bacterium]
MNVTLGTTKKEAMSHLRTLMKGHLSNRDDDRVTLTELNNHYVMLQKLEGETLEELYAQVCRTFTRLKQLSELFDGLGVAGLLAMIVGVLLTAYASLGLALGVVAVGLLALLSGGTVSALVGKAAEQKETELDHLVLCQSLICG